MIITLLSLDTRAEYLCRILVGSMLPVTAGVWLCGTIISNKFNKVFMEKYKFSERVIKISDIKGHWLPFFTLLTLYILMCIKSRINSPKDIATVTSLGGFLILFILPIIYFASINEMPYTVYPGTPMCVFSLYIFISLLICSITYEFNKTEL